VLGQDAVAPVGHAPHDLDAARAVGGLAVPGLDLCPKGQVEALLVVQPDLVPPIAVRVAWEETRIVVRGACGSRSNLRAMASLGAKFTL
jgi:hypothetical protein